MNPTTIYKSPADYQAVMRIYDNALARWSVPYEAMTLPTRHGDTFAIASGDVASPVLLLLHGAGSNSAMWGADVAAYTPHFRVYAIDLIGEAGKSAPNRPPWEGPAFHEWLTDVLAGLSVDRVTLVGLSQGGWTALKFATTHPERVEKLVLLAPGGVVPDRPSFLPRVLVLMLLGKWGQARLVRAIYGRQPIPPGVIEITTTMTRAFKPRIGVLPTFTEAELRRLTMPTLLIGGGQDIIRDNQAIATRLQQCLPHCKTVILPTAGHALLSTTPHVLPFLTQHTGSAE